MPTPPQEGNAAAGRPVRESQVAMTELVLPNDANVLGNLLGGQLMHLIDIAAAIAAARHSHCVCVTASVDGLQFLHPIRTGELVLLSASVNRVFGTSMEVGVKVFAENLITGARVHANSAYLTFVALNAEGKPVRPVPVIPETEEEKRRFAQALERRTVRLAHKKG
jgi:acyl-CoA hydrolase